jgi:Domain of unknown function (DUF4253)
VVGYRCPVTSEPPLPPELAELFPDGNAVGRRLSIPLPPGRAVASSEEDSGSDGPVYWLSDGPAPEGLWGRLCADHAHSGLWPLLVGGEHWEAGYEFYPGQMSAPEDHDPAILLARWWHLYTKADDTAALTEVTAPYGRQWPGLAPRLPLRTDPEAAACAVAGRLLETGPTMRLALIAARGGADALTVAGWSGPVNYTNDTAEISAVLRNWEERFGARVVGASGAAELFLSVAAPPASDDQALRVAAEHFAFCPDVIEQGVYPISAYAEQLTGKDSWAFWWD